jgi:dipeptidyl aminopeptidase/acylaminoacyl peptidase
MLFPAFDAMFTIRCFVMITRIWYNAVIPIGGYVMNIKRLCALVLALMLILAMAGCQDLQQLFDGLTSQTATADPPTKTAEASAESGTDSPIPIEALIAYPDYTQPKISPDGSMVLYRDMTGYDYYVAENWRTGEVTVIDWPAYGIPRYVFWAPDGKTVLFFIDNAGDENYGLYTADIETGETKAILKSGNNNCYYASDVEGNEDEIMLRVLNYSSNSFDLYRVNYKTGDMTLTFTNPGDISSLYCDNTGALRLVTITDSEAGVHVWMKKDASKVNTAFVSSEWEEILAWDYEDAGSSYIYGFMPDNERFTYIDSSIANTATLCSYHTKTGEKATVFNDPGYDLYGAWTDLDLNEVTAVSTYSQKIEWHVLDASFQDDYDALSAIGDSFDIKSSSENDEYWIVEYTSDVSEPDYYLYDMATHETQFLFNSQADLLSYDLCESQPFSYTASDGVEIEGYVTFPKSGTQNLPTVLLVHGGPWWRDWWEYDYEVQLLASRGYLVIRVNYRGSVGYGRDFMLAGDKEWGRAMHQDILDAVDYAVDQGWADADRVGVYGASYGGYEALVCAAFSSDVFQCAIDAFGPSDLVSFMDMDSLPTQWLTEYQNLLRSVGDPETEAEDMKARSPLYYAEQVQIPLLIAQGANDPRVLQSQSDTMVEALEDAGKDVQYLLFPDAGHGFSSPEIRMAFYSAMEEFFAQHLGGRTSSQ